MTDERFQELKDEIDRKVQAGCFITEADAIHLSEREFAELRPEIEAMPDAMGGKIDHKRGGVWVDNVFLPQSVVAWMVQILGNADKN